MSPPLLSVCHLTSDPTDVASHYSQTVIGERDVTTSTLSVGTISAVTSQKAKLASSCSYHGRPASNSDLTPHHPRQHLTDGTIATVTPRAPMQVVSEVAPAQNPITAPVVIRGVALPSHHQCPRGSTIPVIPIAVTSRRNRNSHWPIMITGIRSLLSVSQGSPVRLGYLRGSRPWIRQTPHRGWTYPWASKAGGGRRGRVPSSEKFRRDVPPDSIMKWPNSGAFSDF